MQFANWDITDSGIEWKGSPLQRFEIQKDQLTETTGTEEGQTFYKWILLATEEDWLTQNDLYDLNYAFVYAMAKFGFDFDYDIFDDTLEEQFDQLDMEDREDFEL